MLPAINNPFYAPGIEKEKLATRVIWPKTKLEEDIFSRLTLLWLSIAAISVIWNVFWGGGGAGVSLCNIGLLMLTRRLVYWCQRGRDLITRIEIWTNSCIYVWSEGKKDTLLVVIQMGPLFYFVYAKRIFKCLSLISKKPSVHMTAESILSEMRSIGRQIFQVWEAIHPC